MYPPQIGTKRLDGPDFLGIALFAACLYAAFAGGAIRPPDAPRLQVGVSVITAVAATVALGRARRRAARGARGARRLRLVLTGPALLAVFLAWSTLSLAWSAAPDATWVTVNRLADDALVLGLALALGASAPRPLHRARDGLLLLVGLVLLDGLGQKVLPGLHIHGLVNLDQTGTLARLQAPLGYWNALALLLVLGAPAALSLTLTGQARRRLRTGAFILLELIVVGVGFTESRGGLLALAVALLAAVLLTPDRLMALITALAAVLAGVLELVIVLPARPLTGNGIALPAREHAGLLLAVILVAVATLSALALPRIEALAPRLTTARRRRVGRLIGRGLVAVVFLGLLGAALSHRGLTGQVSHLWTGFNHADAIATSGVTRIFSDSSANRVDWWGQALAAFAQRPLGGWGAGAFPVINLLFRHTTISALDAHSVPLQWLADTGMIGAGLALAAWIALLRAGWVATWRAGAERVHPTRLDTAAAAERLAAGALFAAALAYSVHALYDWDWEIPGVTLPVLAVLGVLSGGLLAGPARRRPRVVPPPVTLAPPRRSPTLRLVTLSLLVALCTLLAVAAILPGLAATRADTALAEAAQGTPAALAAADRHAAQAAALDPLSAAGPLARASVALAEGAPGLARDFTIVAIRREPTDVAAWQALVRVDLSLHRGAEALTAARRVLSLDPTPGVIAYLELASQAIQAQLEATPPQNSASATPSGA
ncbi:MAG TPA: O-antigen ligase family protein [Solirubrobacteraceae bacterium]|nr:O-antigen ligase family protein [Solirubrobacteraceae bacterium]